MKLAAHPLVVAAALGLVGPKALMSPVEDELEMPVMEAHPHLQADAQAPSTEQIARVEEAWLQLPRD